MRIFSAILPVLALAGCSASPGEGKAAAQQAIACAMGGAADFAGDCTAERVTQQGKAYLILRHADGSFRRFEVLADGTGLAAADGADAAQTTLTGNQLEVTVGKDRYRVPVALNGDAAKP